MKFSLFLLILLTSCSDYSTQKNFSTPYTSKGFAFISTNEKEFSQMVDNIRLAEKSLGSGKLKISKSSKKNFSSRRSIYVSRLINKGDLITKQNIKIVRPHFGLHPKYYKFVLNKKSKKKLQVGERLKLDYVRKK